MLIVVLIVVLVVVLVGVLTDVLAGVLTDVLVVTCLSTVCPLSDRLGVGYDGWVTVK